MSYYLPMKWSEGQRTGDENAPTAALGCPNLNPGIFPPDISTKNLTFGTLVRAFPYKHFSSEQKKTILTTCFTLQKLVSDSISPFPTSNTYIEKDKTNYSKQGRI